MHAPINQGYILLADISGFEPYLAKVELDHAQGVVQELLELIIDQLTPPLFLASLEGDGVLTYAPAQRVHRGESLLELCEATYVSFRDRVTAIHRNNTCACRACQAVPSLDLKFLLHYGDYTAQGSSAGSVELGGLDANLVRDRLLKDQVSGSQEIPAYILFTEQSLDQMGIHPDGMTSLRGEYPHMGEVQTALLDLRPRYQSLTEARHAYVSPQEADVVLEHDFPAPPAVVWDWLNDPARRTRWNRLRTWTPGLRPGGRMGIGASNHCSHGVGVIVETVQDWRPYEYFTVLAAQDSILLAFRQTYQLEPLPDNGGTHLRITTRLDERTPGWYGRLLLTQVAARMWKQDLARLADLITDAA